MNVTYHTQTVDNVEVFYREAGPADAPNILLLHGFPSSSHMFRDLIPIIGKDYHIVAPDLPGFGNTIAPSRDNFTYTFDHLSEIIDEFTVRLGLNRFAMYVFDYGAPVGFRIARKHPEKITAIITQNGNAYNEGLGNKWSARKDYWDHPTLEKRNSYRNAFAPETIRDQYLTGAKPHAVSPDGYTLDIGYMSRPGNAEIQLDLIFDYQTNVNLYPEFQNYSRTYQPALLAVWGKNDRSFIPAGAKAFKKDVPNAEIHLLDTGHFALETHADEIGERILDFLKRPI
ncbi:alpha/beta fold hydrolase [Sporolactobacillus laevolacticus]|uniref:alpha/beta fold hydrolase n=1 Tax=Sporolactobacillus laevolacticus TaxID=33018 RepID=UPI0025B47C87|nr:alpha/beta hydrolase [Sporolactobacillus laevolacticus]MDN3955025.1 alpha/beta hydrolase [Sporolactobacillus laevolacticus]